MTHKKKKTSSPPVNPVVAAYSLELESLRHSIETMSRVRRDVVWRYIHAEQFVINLYPRKNPVRVKIMGYDIDHDRIKVRNDKTGKEYFIRHYDVECTIHREASDAEEG